MTKLKIIIFLFFVITPLYDKCLSQEHNEIKLFDYIKPFSGTKSFDSGNRLNLGKLSPGVRAPNGNIVFGPISITGGDNTSGYSFYDTWIEGFSPNILDGAGGLGEFGNFMFIPFSSNKQIPFKRISPLTRSINLTFKKDFIKSNEKAEAGFYSVDLPKIESNFRITADKDIGLLEINDYSTKRSNVKIYFDPTRRTYGTCRSTKLFWIDINHIGLEIDCPSDIGGWGLNPLKNYKGYKVYSVIKSNTKINSIDFLEKSRKRIIPNQEELGFLKEDMVSMKFKMISLKETMVLKKKYIFLTPNDHKNPTFDHN